MINLFNLFFFPNLIWSYQKFYEILQMREEILKGQVIFPSLEVMEVGFHPSSLTMNPMLLGIQLCVLPKL